MELEGVRNIAVSAADAQLPSPISRHIHAKSAARNSKHSIANVTVPISAGLCVHVLKNGNKGHAKLAALLSTIKTIMAGNACSAKSADHPDGTLMRTSRYQRRRLGLGTAASVGRNSSRKRITRGFAQSDASMSGRTRSSMKGNRSVNAKAAALSSGPRSQIACDSTRGNAHSRRAHRSNARLRILSPFYSGSGHACNADQKCMRRMQPGIVRKNAGKLRRETKIVQDACICMTKLLEFDAATNAQPSSFPHMDPNGAGSVPRDVRNDSVDEPGNAEQKPENGKPAICLTALQTGKYLNGMDGCARSVCSLLVGLPRRFIRWPRLWIILSHYHEAERIRAAMFRRHTVGAIH
jgi:hypothetical protein